LCRARTQDHIPDNPHYNHHQQRQSSRCRLPKRQNAKNTVR
jgi:hypothetical protein